MRRLLDPLASFVSWHRRAVAAVLVGLAVLLLAHWLRAPEPGVEVVALARDVPAGHTLTAADLTITRVPDAAAPEAHLATTDGAIGRSTAVALTRSTVLQPGLLSDREAAAPGRALVPVAMPDDALAGLLRPGQAVTLVAAGPEGLEVVTDDARVVSPPAQDGAVSQVKAASATADRMVLVDVPAGVAPLVASLGQGGGLSVILGRV